MSEINIRGKERQKIAVGKKKSRALIQSQGMLQAKPWEVLELGWPFRIVPHWGMASRTLYPCIDQSLPKGREVTLSDVLGCRTSLYRG